ncbi:hypothetical protein [Rhodoferax fermentans]|uniref:Uncharacterized protein n=1 Tax=Rhodoferax fermentans TaxID=28066 RepID=A0A1T1AP94_RHOFE|nr:hypothetical protein [Rhodoferax fermentans]MBK1683444.1 hypothetical protein [Rhodoferax fermentans]OOV05813.1 hypothetical protein RF819_02985 [Rhodoferax fermentans]
MRKRTTYLEDVEGVDCELTFEPVEWIDMHKAKVDDKYVVAYCVQDNDYRDIDDLLGDCMGKMYSFHRHAGHDDHSNGLEALGNTSDGEADLDAVWDRAWHEATDRLVKRVMLRYELADIAATYDGTSYEEPYQDQEKYVESCLRQDCNDSGWANIMYDEDLRAVLEEMWSEPAYFPGDKDAQLLDVYSHSGEHWSLSGGGMRCRWDTASGAGVWVPDEYLRQQLDDDEAKGKDRADQARTYCEQFLDTYNDIISGNVFGCVVEWFDEDGTSIDHDSCWGFIGDDHAQEALKSEFFDPVCKRLADEVPAEAGV